MLQAFVLSVLTQTSAPTPTRLVIWAGGKTQAEAKEALAAFEARRKQPSQLMFLELAAGYPTILESTKVPGLNPGFFIVALGVCESESDDAFRLLDFIDPATYSKEVSLPLACPTFPTPQEPESVDYRVAALERKTIAGNDWSFAAVTSSGNAPEGETKNFRVTVQVRKKAKLVAELTVDNVGDFAELMGQVSFTANGVQFRERNVNPSCAWGRTEYELTEERHTIRFDGQALVEKTDTFKRSSGKCE